MDMDSHPSPQEQPSSPSTDDDTHEFAPPEPSSSTTTDRSATLSPSATSQLTSSKSVGEPATPSDSSSNVIIPRKPSDWEPWKDVLYELYIIQNQYLKDIIQIMDTWHNLRAT